ncbi:MAG: HDOD domain-containing protein [Terriglobales bacterium]
MRKRLLFVDDEPLVLQGLRRALHSMREEWETNFVSSGAEALQALSREPYDAVITDMRMPGMDGAQLLEEVKCRHPEVVRVVLSGQSSREAVLRSVGPTHQYLSKPCDPQELKLRLAQAFGTRDLLKNSAVKALVSGLKSIPSLPAFYDDLRRELESDDCAVTKIAAIISKDVGMTAKILQLANSAFIGLRCHVSSPTQAVCMIGTEMVRALVLSIHIFSQFEGRPALAASLTTLWEHSIQVASLAQRIATSEKCSKQVIDESFTAGLLHDAGKAVLLAEMPKQYCPILERIAANPETEPRLVEREGLGCTHADVGAYLMGIWGLPSPLLQAVAFHDHPSDSGEQRFSPLIAVHSADAIASAADSSPISQDIRLDDSYLAELGLQEKQSVWRGFYEEQMNQRREKGSI